MDRHHEGEQQAMIAQERVVLKEWIYLQQSLLHFASTALHSQLFSWRVSFENNIDQVTERRARIWWEGANINRAVIDSSYLEMRHQQHHYGILELAAGYLVANTLPGLPQLFADLCALLCYKAEHEGFVNYHLAQLPTTFPNGSRKALTPREKEVLSGLMCGEGEHEMAHRLGITPTTVHSHIQRLYIRLDVHSAQEAILRAFELRLVDWLDIPEK